MRRLRGVVTTGEEVYIPLYGGEVELRLPNRRRLRGVPRFPQTQALLASVPVTAYTLTPHDVGVQTDGAVVVPATSYTLTQFAPITAETRRIPVTPYTLTAGAPTITSLSLTVTTENELLATGTGTFTISITQPVIYQGVYSADQSAEGGAANFSFEALLTAPMCVVKPAIVRFIDADGSGTDTAGDTFQATPGLWVYDGDDIAVVAGQWHLDGSPISGATALTRLQPDGGDLTYVETVTGAGTTRTAVSNTRTVADAVLTVVVPVTAYTLTVPVLSITYGFWDVTAGDASATLNGFPDVPTSPAWNITAGDVSATITAYPGGA